MKPWSIEIWRLIAVVSLSASVLLGSVIVYSVLAFKSNIAVILKGSPICLQDAASFDSIAAAQAIGRLDLVSFLLTAGGILLGTFSLFGFWIIRREARDAARDAASEEVRTIAQLYFGKNETKTDGDEKYPFNTHIDNTPSVATAVDPAKVSVSGAVEEKGGQNG